MSNHLTLAFQKWSKVASTYMLVMGASVLIGWYTGFVPLKRMMPGSIVIKENTGALFLLAGLALWLLHAKVASRWLVTVRRLCSGLVLVVGAATLGEYLFGWNLGIDQLLIRETLEYGGVFPGRMAPTTALNFTFLGAALLFLGEFRWTRAAEFLTLPIALVSLQATVAYLYGEPELYRVGDLTPIALPTAVSFLIACAAVLFARPDEGWMAVLTTEGGAGMLGRRLLPAALVTPIILGWLRLLAESAGRFSPQFIGAVAAVANVVIYQVLVAWSVLRLHQIGLGRQQAEDEVRRLNRELEVRVLRRTAQLASANELVQEERDLLDALMDNVPDTIYFKDTASRFTRVNRAQVRTLGLKDAQQAIGKTDADFFAAVPAAAFLADEQSLLKTGRPLIDHREFNPTAEGADRWFSATKVPLLDRQGRTVGLMGISRDITRHVQDQAELEQANANLGERIKQMELIIELDEQLQACVSEAEVFVATARLVSRLFPGEQGAVYSLGPEPEFLETAVTWGTPPLPKQSFEVGGCWAMRRGKPHYSGGDRPGEVCMHVAGSPAAYSLCLPLSAAGERLGILHLRTAPSDELRDSTDIEKQSAQLAADSLAQAWANVRLRASLHEQAVRDPLTGLFNRRHMQASLEREVRRAARSSKPIGIILLDIDHFKGVNDKYGHEAGDAVLRELGLFLKQHTRGGDIACRFGGEEFVTILPEATLEQTQARAEQHRQQFEAVRIESNGRQIKTPTLSIGVAAYPMHGATAEELLRAADAALYRAKEAGRNRVVTAG